MYEFLPIAASIVAIVIGFSKRLWSSEPGNPYTIAPACREEPEEPGWCSEALKPIGPALQPPPTLSFSSSGASPAWLAFSLAGEKMPWLTLHIALPTILAASFGLGYIFHTFDIAAFQAKRGWLLVGVLLTAVVSLWMLLSSLLGPVAPFRERPSSS